MKQLDYILQKWRIRKALPHLRANSRVLDIGCADGALFRALPFALAEGVGLDPDLHAEVRSGYFHLRPGKFPHDLPADPAGTAGFDTITAFAVLEHIPRGEQKGFADSCAARLKAGGNLILTVPSPWVDPIIDVLRAVKVLDGMETEQHYGFNVRYTIAIFAPSGFTLVDYQRFQLGLNSLFVFRKS